MDPSASSLELCQGSLSSNGAGEDNDKESNGSLMEVLGEVQWSVMSCYSMQDDVIGST